MRTSYKNRVNTSLSIYLIIKAHERFWFYLEFGKVPRDRHGHDQLFVRVQRAQFALECLAQFLARLQSTPDSVSSEVTSHSDSHLRA